VPRKSNSAVRHTLEKETAKRTASVEQWLKIRMAIGGTTPNIDDNGRDD
jgi:hypothetical protein